MTGEIKILCPARKCGKCRRMVTRAEEAVKDDGQGIHIVIEDNLNEILKYPAWILPTMVINGKVLSQGKIPVKITLKHWLKQEMNQ
ncbi:MAG: thioredoxin family protein [Bacteroidales bacterium]|nr:thioredoxin family protein [Bacteroidales bacterium]